MEKIEGIVAIGFGGVASENLKRVKHLIQERMDLPELVDGTLNIKVAKYYPITAVDAVITPQEYNHNKECIKLKRCRIRGLKGVIVRPSQHDNPDNEGLWFRVEIMSHHELKQELNLKIDDIVEIEVEKETKNEDEWWNTPEKKQM